MYKWTLVCNTQVYTGLQKLPLIIKIKWNFSNIFRARKRSRKRQGNRWEEDAILRIIQ